MSTNATRNKYLGKLRRPDRKWAFFDAQPQATKDWMLDFPINVWPSSFALHLCTSASPTQKAFPMQVLTRPQRLALSRIYSRTLQPNTPPSWSGYRSFRSFVLSTIGCDGAVVVPFAGMFLCVERDGYTHS